MYGIGYELIAFFVVGVVALAFVEFDNVVVKLIAAVVAMCGIMPLASTAITRMLPQATPFWFDALLTVTAAMMLAYLTYELGRKPDIALKN